MTRLAWHTTHTLCPHCGGMTEEAESRGLVIAERCPRCKWEVGMQPKPAPRLFGSTEAYKFEEMEMQP